MLYVQVCENESDEPIEMPAEEDGTLLLSTLTAHFPGSSGLKYRLPENQGLRGVKMADGRFHPPEDGWSHVFTCVFPKSDNKRKSSDEVESSSKTRKLNEVKGKCTDLIVLGLPWKTNDKELKEYFEQYGEIVFSQVKVDHESGRSKGFGFIRFADPAAQKRVLAIRRHMIEGRVCDVKISGFKEEGELSGRLFVSRCTEEIGAEDLQGYFSQFGEVIDVFLPKPYRGFAFVTFMDAETAEAICDEDHIIKGQSVHVSNAAPRNEFARRGRGRGRPGRGSYNPRMNDNMGGWVQGDGSRRYSGNQFGGGSGGGIGGGGGGSGDSNMNPLNMLAALSQASMGLFENLRQQMQDGSGGQYNDGNQYGSRGSWGQNQGNQGGGQGGWGYKNQESWYNDQGSSWRGRGRSNEEYPI